MSDTTSRVQSIVCQLLGLDEVQPETKLNSLGMDELDSVMLVMEVEDEFGIEILDEEWDNLGIEPVATDGATIRNPAYENDPEVHDIVTLVARKLAEQNAKRS